MISFKIIKSHKVLADGTARIVLRVIKNRKKKIISLNFTCKPDEFDNQEFKKTSHNSTLNNKSLLKLRLRAQDIIDNAIYNEEDLSLDEFEKRFLNIESTSEPKVYDFFNEIIDENLQSGRTGNARAYQETRDSLFKFTSKQLKFKDITPGFLDKYEVFMRSRGNIDGGIAFKMRELRAIINKAIKRGIIDKAIYSFDNYKISKLKKKTPKRALSIDDFRKIQDFNTLYYPTLTNSHNYFLFSFYTRGMNFVDMMNLKWLDIRDNKIIYTRSKTKKEFIIRIIPPVQKILDYYKELYPDSEYVFPIILQKNPTPMYIENRKKKILQRFNNDLKTIAKEVGVKTNITSYVARHSYATIMKMKGMPTDKISESMGHANLQITQVYLKGFGIDEIDDANDLLLTI